MSLAKPNAFPEIIKENINSVSKLNFLYSFLFSYMANYETQK